MAFPVLYLYPFNADLLVKQNHTVNVTRLTNAHPLPESLIITSALKSGYAIMQRSVTSLFFVGDYVLHSSVLDTYYSSNSNFINISLESESHMGQNQTTMLYVSTLHYFCFFFAYYFWLGIQH
jgi:hypothetical protein